MGGRWAESKMDVGRLWRPGFNSLQMFLSVVELAKPVCSSLISQVQSPQTTINSGQRAVVNDVRLSVVGHSHRWGPLVGRKCEGWLYIDPGPFKTSSEGSMRGMANQSRARVRSGQL